MSDGSALERTGQTGVAVPIEYPKRNESQAAFRRIIEVLAQGTPVTAALAHLYAYTHPSQFERDVECFLRDIAATVNGHEERLAALEVKLRPRSVISSLALDVAFHMLRVNRSGRCETLALDALCEAFPDIERDRMEEATAELSLEGYATTSSAIGLPVRAVHPNGAMFLGFDLPATGRDTRGDALSIARRWMEDKAAGNVLALSKQLDWEPRRLNPALLALRPTFGDGRWSREVHPTLVTTSVLVTPEERFKLRRMVDSGQVD